MRTINDKKLTIMGFSTVQTICIFISAAFALQEPMDTYVDTIGALGYLLLACLCEWVKYKITHQYKDDTQG